jgi:3-deoxy-manno-octulosonate cytidylyltransferase (CMP-KDO synthetase)
LIPAFAGMTKIEGMTKLDANDIIINLQGDEPEIDPANIDYLANLLIKNRDCPMATLAAEFKSKEDVANPNIVKVVIADSKELKTENVKLKTVDKASPCEIFTKNLKDEMCGRAIYFSRAVIPYDREKSGVGDIKQYLRHIGIYAYRKEFLEKITALPQSRLEKIEKLEQLRALENGYTILVGIVKHTCDGIDTQEQYAEFVKRLKKCKG